MRGLAMDRDETELLKALNSISTQMRGGFSEIDAKLDETNARLESVQSGLAVVRRYLMNVDIDLGRRVEVVELRLAKMESEINRLK